MNVKTIALLYPGNMGATIGAAAATSGARVVWASHQRSKATQERARQAGLVDVENLADAVRTSDLLLSVCPPHAALELARRVAEHKFNGIYVDANAVSRATAEQIGAAVTKAGASFVDGGIIGSPVKRAGTTRLYLSGARAAEVAGLFSASMLDARTIGEKPGAASALKMAYAAWSKGSDALVLAVRALAAIEGVDKALVEEWALSQPDDQGTLAPDILAGVIDLLMTAEQQGPPVAAVHLLLANATAQARLVTPAQAEALRRGLAFFPRLPELQERLNAALRLSDR